MLQFQVHANHSTMQTAPLLLTSLAELRYQRYTFTTMNRSHSLCRQSPPLSLVPCLTRLPHLRMHRRRALGAVKTYSPNCVHIATSFGRPSNLTYSSSTHPVKMSRRILQPSSRMTPWTIFWLNLRTRTLTLPSLLTADPDRYRLP